MGECEEQFLETRPEWTTHSAALRAAFEEYMTSPKFQILKAAGWKITARPYRSMWFALWLVRDHGEGRTLPEIRNLGMLVRS